VGCSPPLEFNPSFVCDDDTADRILVVRVITDDRGDDIVRPDGRQTTGGRAGQVSVVNSRYVGVRDVGRDANTRNHRATGVLPDARACRRTGRV